MHKLWGGLGHWRTHNAGRHGANTSVILQAHPICISELAPAQSHRLISHSRNPNPLHNQDRQLTLYDARSAQQQGSARHTAGHRRTCAHRMHTLSCHEFALHAAPRNRNRPTNYGLGDIGYRLGTPLRMLTFRTSSIQPPPCNRMRDPAAPLALPRLSLPSGRVSRSPHAHPPLLPMRARGRHHTLGGAH